MASYINERFHIKINIMTYATTISLHIHSVLMPRLIWVYAGPICLSHFLFRGFYICFVLQLIINWVHVDKSARQEHFLPLLRQLRFPTMELEELEDIPKEVLEFREIREEVTWSSYYLSEDILSRVYLFVLTDKGEIIH